MNSKLAAAAISLAACALAPGARAQAADPNLAAVNAVCGRCHGASQFMDKPRSWERWNDVFQAMSRLGATGTDEQLEQVTSYFLDHLTTLNVNTGTPEELAWVLGVSDGVAEAVVERRRRAPFASLAELAAVPGIDGERLERLKPRIQF